MELRHVMHGGPYAYVVKEVAVKQWLKFVLISEFYQLGLITFVKARRAIRLNDSYFTMWKI